MNYWQVVAIGIAIIMAGSTLKEIAVSLKAIVVELTAIRVQMAKR